MLCSTSASCVSLASLCILEGRPTPISPWGTSQSQGLRLPQLDSATTITNHTQSHSTCHPVTLILLLPTFLALWLSQWWDARIVKLPLPWGAIQSLQAPAHNKTGSPPREKTNVWFRLFAIQARKEEKYPFQRQWIGCFPGYGWSNELINFTRTKWNFCWPIYVIGGVPNDVLEVHWVSWRHSSLQMRLVN